MTSVIACSRQLRRSTTVEVVISSLHSKALWPRSNRASRVFLLRELMVQDTAGNWVYGAPCAFPQNSSEELRRIAPTK
jgi:hypothetical protein